MKLSSIQIIINICLFNWTIVCETMRNKRYLIFPFPGKASTKVQLVVGLGLPMEIDVSTIVGYVLKFNYNLPYNASYLTESYVHYERSLDHVAYHPNEQLNFIQEDYLLSRWDIYRMIELTLDGSGPGRICLLRVICETAALPFHRSSGIFSQLLHILLTPSSTFENYLDKSDQEYYAAEKKGKENYQNCYHLFAECNNSILDYFTETTFV